MNTKLKMSVNDACNIDNILELELENFIYLEIGTSNIIESNRFLISLWNEFDEKIAPGIMNRCPWAYLPNKYQVKEKKITYFGSMKTRLGYIHVAVSYKTLGSIDKMHFFSFECDCSRKPIKSYLKEMIENAKNDMNHTNTFLFECNLTGFNGENSMILKEYHEEKFSLYNKNNNSFLRFIIDGQNHLDAYNQAIEKVKQIVAFLSVETNICFNYDNENIILYKDCNRFLENKSENIYQECVYKDDEHSDDGKFIDFFAEKDNMIILSKSSVVLINKIIEKDNNSDTDLNIFLDSCFHFKKGLEDEFGIKIVHAEKGNSMCLTSVEKDKKHQTIIDESITAYLSAIETVTLIGNRVTKCESCGQSKYKINQRVSSFINTYLWDGHGDLFKKIYNLRSLYLHKGKSCTNDIGLYIKPLMDVNTGTGSIDYGFFSLSVKGKCNSFHVSTIREWTSYALRNYYKACLIY